MKACFYIDIDPAYRSTNFYCSVSSASLEVGPVPVDPILLRDVGTLETLLKAKTRDSRIIDGGI